MCALERTSQRGKGEFVKRREVSLRPSRDFAPAVQWAGKRGWYYWELGKAKVFVSSNSEAADWDQSVRGGWVFAWGTLSEGRTSQTLVMSALRAVPLGSRMRGGIRRTERHADGYRTVGHWVTRGLQARWVSSSQNTCDIGRAFPGLFPLRAVAILHLSTATSGH